MANPRQIADQLRRFVVAAENPSGGQSSSLSDVGFLLLSLKDHLLVPDQRGEVFIHEFVSRPLAGLDLLIRVIVALQGIVNSSGSSSKISNILGRSNSSGSRKRKAAVAEADSIECLKILLEKSPLAWRAFMENSTSLEVVLYSVNSPQLDSKCYALEIVLLLLDQPQGFVVLWRSLTLLSARNRDYVRLSIFVAQLKHGLHTAKLHIQILVVRLMNKLLGQAPSANHRLLAQVEASLAQFSPDYLEKLVLDMNQPLGGLDVLLDELSLYRSLCISVHVPRYENGSATKSSGLYSYASESESDSASKRRGIRGANSKFVPTAVVKSVERQRMKRQEGRSGQGYYPNRSTYANTLDPHSGEESMYQSTRNLQSESAFMPNGGGMRRAKSESAMQFTGESDEGASPKATRLKRLDEPLRDYNPLHTSRLLSKSIHDLSRRPDDDRTSSLQRPASRPPSAQEVRTRSLQRAVSPTQRARFADPPIMDTPQQPHGGFSYLFPTAPVVASVVTKRPVTPSASLPSERGDTNSLGRPASRGPVSSSASSYSNQRSDGQVTYIPINVEKEGGVVRRYEKKDDSRPIRTPSSGITDDVRDALSRFDYLNDYEGGSPRQRPPSIYKDY